MSSSSRHCSRVGGGSEVPGRWVSTYHGTRRCTTNLQELTIRLHAQFDALVVTQAIDRRRQVDRPGIAFGAEHPHRAFGFLVDQPPQLGKANRRIHVVAEQRLHTVQFAA